MKYIKVKFGIGDLIRPKTGDQQHMLVIGYEYIHGFGVLYITSYNNFYNKFYGHEIEAVTKPSKIGFIKFVK